MAEILVINPNSSISYTRAIAASIAALPADPRYGVRCTELSKSPPGIDTDEHVAEVIPNIIDAIEGAKADAFVIACFSDPGIDQARAAARKPVVGIAEAAYLSALTLGRKFGIVSLGPSSIVRHLRYLRALEIEGRLAGDRSIDTPAAEITERDALESMLSVGRRLRDDDGADSLVLGCAGMGRFRHALEEALQLPVIDPVQAGVALARERLDLFNNDRPL